MYNSRRSLVVVVVVVMVSGWSRRSRRPKRQQRNDDDDDLNELYFDPKRAGSYGGVDALHRASIRRRPTVERWLAAQDAYTLHKPVKRHFKRRCVIVGGRNQQWQADLVDLTRLKKHNDGITFLLTVIDVFSKRAWCVPLKSKSGPSLVAAFERLLLGGAQPPPNALQTDKGTEFLNRPLQTFLKKRGVHHFVTHNEETKASVVERFNRTLKTRMWRYFTKHETLRYVEALPDFVHSYNNAYHRSIGRTPASVDATNQEAVWQRLYGGGGGGRRKKPKLREGDCVRISKVRGQFKKGYMPNWSEELFTVVEVHPSEPPVYRLKDDAGTPVEGTFYEQEVQRVVVPKDKQYRVEAVLQRRRRGGGSEAFVKWSGYPASFNSWIPASSLVDL